MTTVIYHLHADASASLKLQGQIQFSLSQYLEQPQFQKRKVQSKKKLLSWF